LSSGDNFSILKTSRGKVTIWNFGKLGTEAILLSHGQGKTREGFSTLELAVFVACTYVAVKQNWLT
jgi:hypothetical protein